MTGQPSTIILSLVATFLGAMRRDDDKGSDAHTPRLCGEKFSVMNDSSRLVLSAVCWGRRPQAIAAEFEL
eukprot:3712763-Prymnesium_polylepis.2